MGTSRRQINLRVSEAFLAQLEEVRGGVPREAWIRWALTKVLRERLAGFPLVPGDDYPGRTEPAVAAQ